MVVANDGHVVARGTAQSTTVTGLLLDVGDDGTLRHGGEGEDVADSQGGALAGVDELAGVHALVGDKGLGDGLELVRVTELDLGEGSTTAGVVDDLLHHTTGVAMALSVVEGAELGGRLVETGVSRWELSVFCTVVVVGIAVALTENGSTTLPLIADHTTHGDCLNKKRRLIQTRVDRRRGGVEATKSVPRIGGGWA